MVVYQVSTLASIEGLLFLLVKPVIQITLINVLVCQVHKCSTVLPTLPEFVVIAERARCAGVQHRADIVLARILQPCLLDL